MFWHAEAYEHTVQDLIDSGDLEQCFVGNGVLDLTHKGLFSLKGIENISHAQTITFIDASHNQIKDLSDCSFQCLPNLEQLWLHHNAIEDLSWLCNRSDLTNLRELHLTHNHLHTLDLQHFSKLSMLYVLNVGFNEIATLKPFLLSSRAETRDLFNDSYSNSGVLPHLEVLFLNNNKLTELPAYAFTSCPYLQALYLQDNNIHTLAFDCFKGLFKLRLLYLYNNALTTLFSHIFSDLKKLHILYLRNNAIQHLQDGWSQGLDDLAILDLLHNKLTNLEYEEKSISFDALFNLYKRPFTVLDLGTGLSLDIAKKYDCTCVMVANDELLLSSQALPWDPFNLPNLVVLEKNLTSQDLQELSACEHFDVVLAGNVWKESIDELAHLGDYLFVQTVPDSLDMQMLEMHKNILLKPTWGSPNIRFYPITSTWETKTFYKPRINKTIDWKPGINLWTFKYLNGAYPSKETIYQEIKRLAAFNHGDFVPWNMIVQGNNLELIDWDDNNLLANVGNADACWAQFVC